MQVLETIQEYGPIKHGIFFVSSLLARYHTTTTTSEEDSNAIAETSTDNASVSENGVDECQTRRESIELQNNVESETRLEQHENEAETEFIDKEISHDHHVSNTSDALKKSHVDPQDSHPLSPKNLDRCLCDGDNNSASTPVRCRSISGHDGGTCKCVNDETGQLRNRRYPSSNLTKDENDSVVDSENDVKESRKRRFRAFHDGNGFRFTSRSFRLSIFNRRKKRTKHAKKRGRTLNDYGPPVTRCECATGSGDLCLVHYKSHSESDINTGICRLNDDYLADASDVSVKSFSLAEDDCSDSFVDIDLFRVRNSLIDSTSLTNSEKSFELSSGWSEISSSVLYSSSDPSLAEECRESDIPDTASDFSHDSRSHVRHMRTHRRPKKIHLLGHNVNESFMENECCHCIVM